MIISHKHRFIFIHCRKAAGASVAVSLSRYLGDEDLQFSAIEDGIDDKVYPPRRVLREALKNMTFREMLGILTFRHSFWSTVAKSIKRKYAPGLGRSPTHAPAAAVAATFPEEWRNYYKFCIVRNPWDKTVSDYFWRTKRVAQPPTFEAFVDALERGDSLGGIIPSNHQNWDMYAINNHVEMDFVVRFENLVPGLHEAIAKTGIAWDGWLPSVHMNQSTSASKPKRNYRDYYNDHTREVVARLYEKEIQAFNYQF